MFSTKKIRLEDERHQGRHGLIFQQTTSQLTAFKNLHVSKQIYHTTTNIDTNTKISYLYRGLWGQSLQFRKGYTYCDIIIKYITMRSIIAYQSSHITFNARSCDEEKPTNSIAFCQFSYHLSMQFIKETIVDCRLQEAD